MTDIERISALTHMYQDTYGVNRMGAKTAGMWNRRLQPYPIADVERVFENLIESQKYPFKLIDLINGVKSVGFADSHKEKKDLPPPNPMGYRKFKYMLNSELAYKAGNISFGEMKTRFEMTLKTLRPTRIYTSSGTAVCRSGTSSSARDANT